MSEEHYLKNLIRNNNKEIQMNRISRIQNFINDYKTLSPFLQEIAKGCYEFYQQELMKEYIRLSKHPYPTEYLNPTPSSSTSMNQIQEFSFL